MVPVVVVTGSSGYLGHPLCDRLAQRYRVVGLDRPGAPHPPESADAVDVDLGDDASTREAFATVRARHGARLASVVHLAAYYDFRGAPSPLYDKVTVQGTRRILDALEHFEVEQLVFSSSILVHRPTQPGRPLTEDSPVEASWPYPESKLRTEALLRERRVARQLCIQRIAGVYDDGCHSIPLAHQLQRIYERRPGARVFPGDPWRGQSYLHRHDTLDALQRAVDVRASLPEELTLLVGEPRTVPYTALQAALGRLIHGEPWPAWRVPKAVAKLVLGLREALPGVSKPWILPRMVDLADAHYEVDITRARDTLAWAPRHSLEATLPAMVEALRRDPLRFYGEHQLRLPAALARAAHRRRARPARA